MVQVSTIEREGTEIHPASIYQPLPRQTLRRNRPAPWKFDEETDKHEGVQWCE